MPGVDQLRDIADWWGTRRDQAAPEPATRPDPAQLHRERGPPQREDTMTGHDRDGAGTGDDDRGGAFPNCLRDLAPEVEARVVDASLAVAARDCALEAGDRQAAAVFAAQARTAIATAQAAGITPSELAAELGYPGGHTAMDGPHIDHEIAALPPNGTPNPLIREDRSNARPTSAAGLPAAAAATAEDEAADAARLDQLSRWHHDDHSSVDAEPGRTDGDGWS